MIRAAWEYLKTGDERQLTAAFHSHWCRRAYDRDVCIDCAMTGSELAARRKP